MSFIKKQTLYRYVTADKGYAAANSDAFIVPGVTTGYYPTQEEALLALEAQLAGGFAAGLAPWNAKYQAEKEKGGPESYYGKYGIFEFVGLKKQGSLVLARVDKPSLGVTNISELDTAAALETVEVAVPDLDGFGGGGGSGGGGGDGFVEDASDGTGLDNDTLEPEEDDGSPGDADDPFSDALEKGSPPFDSADEGMNETKELVVKDVSYRKKGIHYDPFPGLYLRTASVNDPLGDQEELHMVIAGAIETTSASVSKTVFTASGSPVSLNLQYGVKLAPGYRVRRISRQEVV